MLYALNDKGERILPSKDMSGHCPVCGEKLIPRIGLIKIPHWAHMPDSECRYSSHETDWHLSWKAKAKHKNVEVRIGNNIADIVNKAGLVIELQKSHINPQEIMERERNYGKMVWLFDFRGKYHKRTYNDKYGGYLDNIEILFKGRKQWKMLLMRVRWKPKTLVFVRKPLFLDFGDFIVFIPTPKYRKRYWSGYYFEIDYFVDVVINGFWLPHKFKSNNVGDKP